MRSTPFKPPVRPVPFVHDGTTQGWADALCPCGSGDQAGDCHLRPCTGRWQLPTYAPLLQGAITGRALPGCYASSTNDCSAKLSNEHWLSKAMLRAIADGDMVTIGGLHWQTKPAQHLPVNRLGANILCDRHNPALSRLDRTATNVQATLDRYQLDQLAKPDSHGSEFDLVSGEEFERWMLKMAWGSKAAAADIPDNLRDPRERNILMRYLFRDGLLPKGWGLYVQSLTKSFARQSHVAVEARADVRQDTLISAAVTLGPITFTFAAGSVEVGGGAFAVHRPSAIRLYSACDQSCKILAFSWDHRRSEPAEFVDIRFRGTRR